MQNTHRSNFNVDMKLQSKKKKNVDMKLESLNPLHDWKHRGKLILLYNIVARRMRILGVYTITLHYICTSSDNYSTDISSYQLKLWLNYTILCNLATKLSFNQPLHKLVLLCSVRKQTHNYRSIYISTPKEWVTEEGA